MIKKFENLKKFTNSNFIAKNSLSFSVVNTECNGKRIRISPKLIKALGTPEYIEILGNEAGTGIYILPCKTGMKLNKGGTLYNSSLVQNLTEEFKLDFSEHTSCTYNNITILEDSGEKYAEVIISLSENSDETQTTMNQFESTNEPNADNEKGEC